MKIPNDEWGDIQKMLVGMSKKVYKEGQRNGHNCIAGGSISTTMWFKYMYTLIFPIMYIWLINIVLTVNFQMFCCRKWNKIAPIQYIKQDD